MTITPVSDGHSTMYVIGDWAAVNNGQPYVDADRVWWSVSHDEGWKSPDDPVADEQGRPVADGQTATNLRVPKRDILIGGTVRAPDQVSLERALDFAAGVLAGQVRKDVLYVAEAHLTRHIGVRRAAKTQVAKQSPYLGTFLFQLVADDPARYGDALSASTALPSSSGGLTFPITFPITFPATVVTGTIGLTNPGNLSAPIHMRVDGPCQGPIISHIGSGAQLVFSSSYSIPAGNWLDIWMGGGRQLRVVENGQASRAQYVISDGSFGFDPGENTYGFNAAVYNAAALLTVTAEPAWA